MAHSTLAGRLKRLISSLAEHGPGHVLEVLRQDRVRRAYAAAPPELPDTSSFLHYFPEDYRSEASCINYLLERSRSLLLPEVEGTEIRSKLSPCATKLVRDADLIASGHFPGLGICINDPTGEFDWHRDYGNGKVWPRDPFNQIRFLDGDGADIKYPWELSRMYWISWIGLARLVEDKADRKRKRSEDFHRLIDNWIEENPIHVGVNWAMPMEVGIRGFWLMMGGAFFGDESEISHSWWLRYYSLLFGHGRYLAHNLEYFPNLTNHYIANCFGLVVLGALFIETTEGKSWFDEGKKRMSRELHRQVTPDGVHYERSISYHALVLEMYLIAQLVAERAGSGFGSDEKEIIGKMVNFTRSYLPPLNADVPQLGDSDDGVILRLTSDQRLYNHTPLWNFGRELLWPIKEDAPPSLLFPLLISEERPMSSNDQHISGGFATLRNSRWHLFADVGPIGLHGNNDTLSFTLHTSDGRAWFIDPGTGCYTRDESLRNSLRSTAAHNTPVVDGEEIARFSGLWRVESDRMETKFISSNLDEASGEEGDPLVMAGEHRAYESLPTGGIRVERKWKVEGNQLEISDRLTGSGKHRVTTGFALPPDICVREREEGMLELSSCGKRGEGGILFSCNYPMTVREGEFSPSYGIVLPTTRIEISVEGEAPLEINYLCRFVSALKND